MLIEVHIPECFVVTVVVSHAGISLLGHEYHTEGLTCLTLSSDSTLAITGAKDGSVHIVNIPSRKVQLRVPCFY